MRNVILCGDAIEQLRTLPDESVHCVVTSPPYWGLRDYGAEGQLGLEATPDEYVCNMVAVFREVRRVLRDDGTVWLNLGDSYATGSSGDRRIADPTTEHWSTTGMETRARARPRVESLKPKDLVGIPWRVAFALQADGWWLRSDIIWSKPNPMPESVTDRPTKAHEYIFLLSKSQTYWYDHEAIKEPISEVSLVRISQPNFENQHGGAKDYANGTNPNRSMRKTLENFAKKASATPRNDGERWNENDGRGFITANGRNKRTVWEVATHPYAEAHFATYPPDLIRPCILAGCPENGVVLDPFFGSGTTGLVAAKAGRDWIGIELNPAYVEMAEKRLQSVKARLL